LVVGSPIETGEAEALRAKARLIRAALSNFMMGDYAMIEIGE
jgi:hypothetical protein